MWKCRNCGKELDQNGLSIRAEDEKRFFICPACGERNHLTAAGLGTKEDPSHLDEAN